MKVFMHEEKLQELVDRRDYYQSLVNAAYSRSTFNSFATQKEADEEAARLRVEMSKIEGEINLLFSPEMNRLQ